MTTTIQAGQLTRTDVGENATYNKRVLYIGTADDRGYYHPPHGLEEMLTEQGHMLRAAYHPFVAGMAIGLYRPRCVIIDHKIGLGAVAKIAQSIRREESFNEIYIILLADGNRTDRVVNRHLFHHIVLKRSYNARELGRHIATIVDSHERTKTSPN